MDINSMKREGLRFLNGLETGNLPSADLHAISENFDPILVYFILKYLRLAYKPGHPDAKGVLERILELTQTYDEIVAAVKSGENDPLNDSEEEEVDDISQDFIFGGLLVRLTKVSIWFIFLDVNSHYYFSTP